MPAIAVCIVTHNSAADLRPCLDALEGQEGVETEVVIADCASSDETLTVARQPPPGELSVTVLDLGENRGFAGGMNAAIAACEAPYVLSLNADTRPERDFLARLLGRMEAHPERSIGAVTGRLYRPDSADGPRRLDACGMRLTRTWRHLDRGSDEVDEGQLSTPERVFGATGAATLYRREALEDVAIDGEPFDPLFHSFREDAELSFRLRERGWEVVYEPSARALHRRFNLPRRRREMPAMVNYHSLKNRYLLRLYHQTLGNALLTLLPALTRDLMALAYALLRERSSLAAYGWLWRRRREILDKARRIRRRRTRPAAEIDRWFRHESLPL